MTAQINPSVTNPTLADIYTRIDGKTLNLAPDFQRKFVWTQEHQEEFIDTILNGFPFPEIYVCSDKVDLVNIKTTQKVIDGQQRLTTIKNYIENDFNKPLKKVIPFSELKETQRKQFLTYKLVVRDIGDVEEDIVREVFRRINLTKFKLDDIEIHNAVYDGHFIQAAKTIALNASLEKFGVFHESEFTRMADIHYILQIMSTIVTGGYYTGDTEIEPSIAKYNEDFDLQDEIINNLLKTFDFILSLDLAPDSIWFRKSNFFTLTVELYGVATDPAKLKVSLDELEANIMINKGDKSNDYGVYYGYMFAGTNNRIARVKRAEILKMYALN
tara:strand:+ start:542 stop:1528 length:987 start_codon:yes stop_codon:yes gene_type:complete